MPAILECEFGWFGHDNAANGWHGFYLGMGNHLMVADSIYDELREIALNRYKYFGIGELYQHWIGVVQEILHSKQL